MQLADKESCRFCINPLACLAEFLLIRRLLPLLILLISIPAAGVQPRVATSPSFEGDVIAVLVNKMKPASFLTLGNKGSAFPIPRLGVQGARSFLSRSKIPLELRRPYIREGGGGTRGSHRPLSTLHLVSWGATGETVLLMKRVEYETDVSGVT